MSVPFLDLRRRIDALRPEFERAVGAVLDGGRFVGGPVVEEFERRFAAYCGAAHAVGVASGTDALTIALLAGGIGPGDDVVTAANTCVPTVAAIERAGARPVLADVDPRTRTLDADAIEAALTPRARAVVPVHLYGRCADMGPIGELARARDLLVVEDAAQAHGAHDAGGRAGTLGTAAAFSFYPTKNLGALGDAGAIVTDDDELARRARLVRSYGEDEQYHSVLSGLNSRLDPLQAAVLLVGLDHLDAWNARRRELAALYRERLDPAWAPPDDEPGHVYHLFTVLARDREAFRATLAARGVDTLVHYPRPVHGHPAYAHFARPGLEKSERLAAQVVSLPLYPELTDAEAEAVADAVAEARP